MKINSMKNSLFISLKLPLKEKILNAKSFILHRHIETNVLLVFIHFYKCRKMSICRPEEANSTNSN